MVPPGAGTSCAAMPASELDYCLAKMNGHSFRRQVYIVICVAALQIAKDFSSPQNSTAFALHKKQISPWINTDVPIQNAFY
jgi:hypothetical protein